MLLPRSKPRQRPSIVTGRARGPRWFAVALCGALGSLSLTRGARAQVDLDPPLPNVMLLVDSSGSMEYTIDGSGFPACDPTGHNPSGKSRWIDLVEVLTGTIQDYRCEAVNRSSSSFLADYDANGPAAGVPYDYLYVNPYHRPMSGDCVALPGLLPSNPYDFPSDAIRYRRRGTNTPCTFNQAKDGILDAYATQIRFGLMTFDPLTDARKGINGTTLDYEAGMLGGWSYEVGPTPKANPKDCLDPPIDFDAGARNAAAPPWEGRMVAFGDPATGSTEYQTKRAQIEQVLLMTRPFGATPIAGLLHDAKNFFLEDDSDDPLAPGKKFGPRRDPYVIDSEIQDPVDPDAGSTIVIRGCREQSIVLLTDGRPNLDLRPHCEGNLGVCPFKKPEEIAAELVARDHPIDTFVIPFALPTFQLNGTTKNCNDLEEGDFDETDPSTPCGDPLNQDNEALQACCVLNRIAVAGARPDKLKFYPNEKPRAFFAQNRDELASALSSVLASTLNVTSRTRPVIAGGAEGTTGMRFFSLVQPRPLRPWRGVLTRERWTCDNLVPKPEKIDRDKGDDFAVNLASGRASRRFVTIQGGNGGSDPILSSRTMRPYYEASGNPDGAGVYGATRTVSVASAFVDAVKPEAMNLTNASCDGLDATACRNRYLKWLIGDDNGTDFSRCDETGCHLLGDILHASPVVVGPPSALVRDETYQKFAATQAVRERPIVLYAPTNDGFLHAFRVGTLKSGADDEERALTRTNNELWAFVPPAVLPDLPKQYPFNHQLLLDATPVVKDVVATDTTGDLDDLVFERVQEDAIQGANSNATWRTVLVQGFGPMRGGYFALDVTNPVIEDTTDGDQGPRFLWQLTTDASGNPIFGRSSTTPVITTLFFVPDGQTAPREVAVALLPGGAGDVGDAGTGVGCPATANNFDSLKFSHKVKPRSRVRCYSGGDVHARSLTVVRLDTGEIVRTFRRSKTEIVNADLRARVIEAAIDSPISGQPVAFPAETGAVADRAYVGDQDGRLWRVDFSSTDPDDWKMELFFDAFPSSLDESPSHDFDDGQPIVFAPVVSVDPNGDVTLNFATGDQETLGSAPGVTNYVWSVTEELDKENRSLFTRRVNWYLPLRDGERVVGPLTLFNSQLFFTTYSPPDSGAPACKNGDTRIWGMDYIRPWGDGTDQVDIGKGGDSRLRPTETSDPVQYLTARAATGDPNAVIFGVSVAQQPTCSQALEEATDTFLGYGAQRQIRNVNPGRFELVMHKGGTSPLSPSGDVTANVHVMPLQSPPTASRIDSWAALVE